MSNRTAMKNRIRELIGESLKEELPELEQGIKGTVINPMDRARALYSMGKQSRSPRIAIPMTELIMMITTLANQPGAESKLRRLINRIIMSPEMRELGGGEESTSVIGTAATYLPKAKFEDQ
jgi:hypothetical protein